MLTLPEIARSRYLLHRALSDVFGPLKACQAVEVLLGPEPDQGDADDFPALEPDMIDDEDLDELSEDFEPAPEDAAWVAEHPALPPISGGAPEPFEPTDADWDDFHRWCEMSDLAELRRRYTDDDLRAAGLAVG